jgi:hypothetical protein
VIRIVVPLLSLGIFDCATVGVDLVRFNSEDDEIRVEVTASLDVGDAVTGDLLSTTGAVVVGEVTVEPGSGPVGTLHVVTIDIDDEYEDIVVRTSLSIDAGVRGLDDFDLTRDSADSGLWRLELESSGVDDETRTDVFTVELFEVDDGIIVDSDTDS